MSASVASITTKYEHGIDLPTWVTDALSTAPHGFTGRVEMNCFEGGIANLNFIWSVKPPKK